MSTESIVEFFEKLQEHIDPDKLEGIDATYRFDMGTAGSWHVTVADRAVQIEESDADADCVVQASAETFEKIVRGKQNPATAAMLGKLKVEGDMSLALKLKQLF